MAAGREACKTRLSHSFNSVHVSRPLAAYRTRRAIGRPAIANRRPVLRPSIFPGAPGRPESNASRSPGSIVGALALMPSDMSAASRHLASPHPENQNASLIRAENQ
jgi:hypothetical protein